MKTKNKGEHGKMKVDGGACIRPMTAASVCALVKVGGLLRFLR